MTRRFVVCIHDATPAYARETRAILRDLAPILGRRMAFGVVPDWYGEWPLLAHPGYCRLVRESCEELLLHGYFHQRLRGRGPATLIDHPERRGRLGREPVVPVEVVEVGADVRIVVPVDDAHGHAAAAVAQEHELPVRVPGRREIRPSPSRR